MKIRLAFIASAAAIACAGSPSYAAGFMPDGTYDYSFKQNGNAIADSTVTVKRSGSVIAIHESQTVTQTQVGSVQLTADETVLADSYEPLTFGCTTVSSGKTSEVKFAYANGSGYFQINGERMSVPVRMLAGTTAMIVQDQSLTLSFLTLPALLGASRATSLTAVVPTASRTFLMSVDPSPQTKPAGVPAADAGVGVALPISFTVWTDPAGVVDEVDVPAQALSINLTKRS
ncbi:MAG: hypothetical protein JO347_06690 [Candidatus Eremiobacteraeota bacterium]|nr:hypothetical protein [Candidatus Eremiobacteraeota bacterium]